MIMSAQYRGIFKAISLFGGTQILQILITFIRSKFIALFIGAEGMGVSSIYNSTITLFVTICGLGIGTSVVRDLAKASDEGDAKTLATVTTIFIRVLSILAIIGTIIAFSLSKYLSIWTFESLDYQTDFRYLSLMVLFTLLQNGNISILVGTRRVKDTAMCSLFGSVAMLITSVPFFYFFGMKGIVPGLVISSFANYLISYAYYRKIKLDKVNVKYLETKKYICSIITLGVAMVASLLLGNLARYVINIAVSRIGSVADIGYYNAAISITFQSISLVFAAMASDYFPRLSAAMKDKLMMNETVRQQTEIILYLVIPILLCMMVASPIVVKVLLTDEFLVINQFIRIVTIGMFFKAISFPLGYLAFAKGDKKIYFWLEGVYVNVSNLLLSVVFYYFWGLEGMAWAMVISYILYYIIVMVVSIKRYDMILYRDLLGIIVFFAIIYFIIYILSNILNPLYYNIAASFLCLFFSILSLIKLNEKVQFISLLKSKLLKG